MIYFIYNKDVFILIFSKEDMEQTNGQGNSTVSKG